MGGGDARVYDYEIYSPYYLGLALQSHKPSGVAFVPTPPPVDPITGADILAYGSQYNMQCAILPANVTLDKVVLIPPGATTHSFDMHQRYIELSTNVTAPNQVTITVPALEDKAPRGVYMLWLVTNTGAVSDAKWVVLQ